MSNSVDNDFRGDAVITFPDVPMAIKAEQVLKQAGWPARLVAPPPEARLGCALGLEILLAQHDGIKSLLDARDLAYATIIKLKKR